jgi:hypothetical protein
MDALDDQSGTLGHAKEILPIGDVFEIFCHRLNEVSLVHKQHYSRILIIASIFIDFLNFLIEIPEKRVCGASAGARFPSVQGVAEREKRRAAKADLW